MSYSQTVTFPEVKAKVTRRIGCTRCGRKMQRSTTFSQTINPWNVNRDDHPNAGLPKTHAEAQAECDKAAAEWNPRDVCKGCRDQGYRP